VRFCARLRKSSGWSFSISSNASRRRASSREYILKEAAQRANGDRLGPVGATIVSEVFVGLVQGDPLSYLSLKGKRWQPSLPSKNPGEFTMADLLRFVGDISPIDGIATV